MRHRFGSGVSLLVFLLGLVLAGACAAGIAEVADKGSQAIAGGTISERFTVRRCVGSGRCTRFKQVRIAIDGAEGTTGVTSDELYALVGPENRQLRVDSARVETFRDRISEVVVGGRRYTTYDQGRGILWVVIPLEVLGLGLMLWGLPGVLAVIARRLPGRTPRKRWIRALVGGLGGVFLVFFCAVGLSSSDYDLGRGELYGAYARVTDSQYLAGAHVRTPFGREERVESLELHDLLGERDSLPANVLENEGGTITGVRYEGKTYSTSPPNWLPLIAFVPLGLYLFALCFVNARLIARGRRPTTPSGLPEAA